MKRIYKDPAKKTMVSVSTTLPPGWEWHGERGPLFDFLSLEKRVEVTRPSLVFKDKDITKAVYDSGFSYENYGITDFGEGYGVMLYHIDLGMSGGPLGRYQGSSFLNQVYVDDEFKISKIPNIELAVDVKTFQVGGSASTANFSMATSREFPVSSSFDQETYKLTVRIKKFEGEGREEKEIPGSLREVAIDIPH